MASLVMQDLGVYGPVAMGESAAVPVPLADARGYVERFLKGSEENFTVASWLLPRGLRPAFAAVYAFCRWADDLGDEAGSVAEASRLLRWWRGELDAMFRGEAKHPVFVALWPEVERYGLPRQAFEDLIDAFEQDQRVSRYDTWEQLLDYCSRSANPVGRLVLKLFGYDDDERLRLSDATCTALQLTNFWQDVRRDLLERDRVYLPRDIADGYGLDVEELPRLVRGDGGELVEVCERCAATVREAAERTWPMFAEGRGLWKLVGGRLRVDVALFTLGGEAVLRRVDGMYGKTLERRPRLGKVARVGLGLRGLCAGVLPGVLGR
ncbi:MAG: squalene synthase HpnC [Planctomycetota bacterium]